ncbi:MAG TPA: hypothetical protein VI382_00475 [Candidatus Manganitrophaceae bacterium]|nr:hypothetical protein [Candidatus Manganitrophaceae bacterium]
MREDRREIGSMALKWKYKAERLAGVQIENQLNFLGAEGWELIQVIYEPEETYPFLCLLKKASEGFD